MQPFAHTPELQIRVPQGPASAGHEQSESRSQEDTQVLLRQTAFARPIDLQSWELEHCPTVFFEEHAEVSRRRLEIETTKRRVISRVLVAADAIFKKYGEVP
jgi:hypothetical protein